MIISKHILEAAKHCLQDGKKLPCQIESAPHFYVAEITDETVRAFSTLVHDDKAYKVGSKK
jgi:hypothetical protein